MLAAAWTAFTRVVYVFHKTYTVSGSGVRVGLMFGTSLQLLEDSRQRTERLRTLPIGCMSVVLSHAAGEASRVV